MGKRVLRARNEINTVETIEMDGDESMSLYLK